MQLNPFQKPAVDPHRQAAGAELIERARRAGFASLLAALADPTMFTADGKLAESRLARALKIDKRRLPAMFAAAREAIGADGVL